MHYIGRMKHGRGAFSRKGKRWKAGKTKYYIPKGCRYHSYWIADDFVMFDSIGFCISRWIDPVGICRKNRTKARDMGSFCTYSQIKPSACVQVGPIKYLYFL